MPHICIEKSLTHYPKDAPQDQIDQYKDAVKAVKAIVRDFPDLEAA